MPPVDPPRRGHTAGRYDARSSVELGDMLVPDIVRDLLNEHPRDIPGVSPGYRFQRLCKLWSGGKANKTAKGSAVRELERESFPQTKPVLSALRERQRLLLGFVPPGQRLTLDLVNISPLVTGLGQEHPLEQGMAFLQPYGVPYLPGSGWKGALAAMASRLGESTAAEILFGYPRVATAGDKLHRRGWLNVWDSFPLSEDGHLFAADIVNVHYPKYYQGEEPPTEWQDPVPNYFLTLRAGLKWQLIITATGDLEARDAHAGEGLAAPWQEYVTRWVQEIAEWGGVGAKKSWGYGLFEAVQSERRTADIPGGSANPVAGTRVTPAKSQIELRIERLQPRDFGQFPQLLAEIAGQPVVEQARLVEVLKEHIRGFGDKEQRKKFARKLEEKFPPTFER